jgi:hypothetical protein
MKKLVADYVSHITEGAEQRYRNMTVFPLLCDRESTADYLLLDEALDAQLIHITEVGESGSVPELKVENRSDRNLLILDGEELVGAKQNRIVNVTLLIAAHASLTIPVSCVEQGRWSYQSQRFMSKERVMPPRMRMRKSAAVYSSLVNSGTYEGNQGETWNLIHEKMADLGVSSQTGALGDIYDQQHDVIDEYLKHFTAEDRQTGMLVTINNRVIGCDCFASHDTLKKTFSKLIKSYVLDAIDADAGKKGTTATGPHASPFLKDVRNCLTQERPSLSLGTDIRLVSQTIIGSALSLNDEIIHLTAFVRDEKETGRKTGYYQRASRRKAHTRTEIE